MIPHTPLDFIVLAYPRSATTWAANWLTTDRSLCLHDPFSLGMPQTWPRDCRLRGISCTGSYLLGDWLHSFDCPVAIIERDKSACDASLEAIGFSSQGIDRAALNAVDGRRFGFDSLWDEDGARDLWAYLLPAIPFDAIRYQLLAQMQVQPHMGKWTPDHSTLRECATHLRAA